jgi:hypothetical protein
MPLAKLSQQRRSKHHDLPFQRTAAARRPRHSDSARQLQVTPGMPIFVPALARANQNIADCKVGFEESKNYDVSGSPKGTNDANNPRSIDRLIGPFSLRLLASIQRLGDRAWGANLQRDLSEMLGRDVAIGQLYTALSKLTDQGLISFWQTDPEPVQGGRSKKVFRLEALGAQALESAATELSA